MWTRDVYRALAYVWRQTGPGWAVEVVTVGKFADLRRAKAAASAYRHPEFESEGFVVCGHRTVWCQNGRNAAAAA